MQQRLVACLGELLARCSLRVRGYRVLVRNWRTRGGELDVIAYRSGTLAIVEVKTHRRSQRNRPREAVTMEKRRRILRTSEQFVTGKRAGTPANLDLLAHVQRTEFIVVEVILLPILRIHHIREAFRSDEVIGPNRN
jgi:Holliday junction resolvase-like predicted endonuclease